MEWIFCKNVDVIFKNISDDLLQYSYAKQHINVDLSCAGLQSLPRAAFFTVIQFSLW